MLFLKVKENLTLETWSSHTFFLFPLISSTKIHEHYIENKHKKTKHNCPNSRQKADWPGNLGTK